MLLLKIKIEKNTIFLTASWSGRDLEIKTLFNCCRPALMDGISHGLATSELVMKTQQGAFNRRHLERKNQKIRGKTILFLLQKTARLRIPR